MRYLVAALLVTLVTCQKPPASKKIGDWYFVGVPQCIRPGLTTDIYVDIIKRVRVDVQVDLYNKTNGNVYASNSATVYPGDPQTIPLHIPSDLPNSWRYYAQYNIRVIGRLGNNIVFTNDTAVSFHSKNVTGFLQTDKPIYKPGQTVNYRIFSLKPNLQINKNAYNIEIHDPKGNKIIQAKGIKSETGLVSGKFELSDEPVFGIWSIRAFVHDQQIYHSFEVKEYVLPRIEVTVTPPSYLVRGASQPAAQFDIDAKYTFGENVRGSLLVTAKLRWWYSRNRTAIQPVVQRRIPVFAGSATVFFTNDEIMKLSQHKYSFDVAVEANLTESLTGEVASSTSYARVYNTAEKVQFESSSARSFKPNLVYTVFAKVSQQDGSPINGKAGDLKVQVQYTYRNKSDVSTTTTTTTTSMPLTNISLVERPKKSDVIWWFPQYVTRNLTHLQLVVPSDGIVEINVRSVPPEAESLSIIVHRNDQKYYWSAQRAHSPSDTFVQLTVLKELRKPGQRQKLRIKSTVPIKSFSLLVTSRGRVVLTREEERPTASKEIGLSFTITRDMAPRAKVVAYFRTESGEIVPDVVTFNVLDPFANTVLIGFSEEEVQPGANVTMTLQTAPNSLVATRVIDKKVLLLKADNDITEEQVTNSLWSFDSCGYGWWGWGRGILERRRRKRSFIPWRYPYYGGGTDAASVFREAGFIILTDSLVYAHNYWDRPESRFNEELSPALGGGVADKSGAPLQEVGKLRTKFPETWLFMVDIADNNGFLNIPTTAPDSITSWQATAFAFNDQYGFGITTEAAKLTVVKPFFANIFMPYSVNRHEELFLQVNVFNYMKTNQTVVVELGGSDNYENLDVDDNGNVVGSFGPVTQTIEVPSGIPKLVIFPIRAVTLGQIPITVTARSTEAADGLTKTIKVEPEGVPAEYNFVELVNLTNSAQYDVTRSISYPPGLVDGSQKLGVKLVGDVLGSTVANLANLVRMSYGCGEQNMVNFAPTVFVSKYLQTVGQLTDKRRTKALEYISKGYQRQMNYKRQDGSYSAFGDGDKEGSLWLTAFVAKSFSTAANEGLLDVDQNALNHAYRFIISKQLKDGSFNNTGKLHNKRLQGQSGKGNGLTAYILTALLGSNGGDSVAANIDSIIKKTQTFVENYATTSSDIYELAIAAYALALAKSPQADAVLNRLENMATTRDGYTFWEVEAEPIYRWQPPARQTKAASIEATSYVCMVYGMKKNIARSSQCLAYLVSQQNDYGGFVSTQDTVVAVQALSAIGPFFYSPTQSGSVTVRTAGKSVTFDVNEQNRLELQEDTLPVSADSVRVTGTGTGVFLVSISAKYHVDTSFIQPAFTLTVTLTKDTATAIELSVCAKYLNGDASNMANIDIRLPSGFALTDESLEELKDATKRVENSDGRVLLYLDEITNSGTCVDLTAAGRGNVNNLKPSPVKVFDYYAPDYSALAFYRPKSLDRDLCDTACANDTAGCPSNCARRRKR